MFGLVHKYRLRLEDRYDAGGGVTAFAFSTPKGSLAAEAGQHVLLALSPTARKAFSLASGPQEAGVVIGTSLASGSAFKNRLGALSKGDTVSVRGPIYTYGSTFTADENAPGLVMLAQGLGITPFRSILSHLHQVGSPVATHLVHVARNGHAFRTDTERWATTSTYLDHAEAFRTAVSDAVDSASGHTFYVAGAPSFVTTTTGLLQDLGLPTNRVRQDKYLFYKPRENLAASKRA